jgi:hypothetical protein
MEFTAYKWPAQDHCKAALPGIVFLEKQSVGQFAFCVDKEFKDGQRDHDL